MYILQFFFLKLYKYNILIIIKMINTDSNPYIEKYRPKILNDILLPNSISDKINNFIKNNSLPNLILTGSPGTGKTSTIICIAKQILGIHYNDLILELNASNNRTLEFINTTVLFFCKKKNILSGNLKKIIIFDEADNITKKAQISLSNIMEQYYFNTIFTFTCNDFTKIIESIQSRCMIIKYNLINEDNIKKKLIHICLKEKINYTEVGIETLIKFSNGDIRVAINNLEATFNGYYEISEENVGKICNQTNMYMLVELIKCCINIELKKAIRILDILKKEGYSVNDLLNFLINILKDIKIKENIRINYIKIISEYYINVSESMESNLQLYACICNMIKYSISLNSNI